MTNDKRDTDNKTVPGKSLNNNVKTNNRNRKTDNRTVPGNTSYAQVTKNGGKNIVLIGDSMIKNIKRHEFKKFINGDAHIKSFSGASTKDMQHYAQPTIERKDNDVVIIHVGTNDCNNYSKTTTEIASSIINVAKKVKASGVNDIVVSSIIKRKNKLNTNKRILEVNDLVSELCVENSILFVNNRNIVEEDICKDNLHLEFSGTCKLANNFIEVINLIDKHAI